MLKKPEFRKVNLKQFVNFLQVVTPQIIRSKRKSLALTVYPDKKVVLRAPNRISQTDIQRFWFEKQDWIQKVLKKMDQKIESKVPVNVGFWFGDENRPMDFGIQNNPKKLLSASKAYLIEEFSPLLKYLQNFVGAGNVKIKFSIGLFKTKWGSCKYQSQRLFKVKLPETAEIKLNLVLAFLPLELGKYVLIHELCHLYEPNHSKKFWDLVQKYCPDYKKSRLYLKKRVDLLEYYKLLKNTL